MKKEIVIDKICENHSSFTNYLSNLTKEEFEFSINKKWSACQQLEHIVLCIKPLVHFFSMDKTFIERNFGRTGRQNSSYEVIFCDYLEKLNQGGKAPGRYEPETTSINKRNSLIETLTTLIKELAFKIESFSEQELDSLQIPHPLLGNLTLKEMLYNTIYHVDHHMVIAKGNLKELK